jgi:hypothetical protein
VKQGNTRAIHTLIDTGALQSNYVSTEVADWLRAEGAATEVGPRREIAGAIRSDRKAVASELVSFLIKLPGREPFEITAQVLDIWYDLIIGRPTIRKHNLLPLLQQHLDQNPTVDPSNVKEHINSLKEKRELLDIEDDADGIPDPKDQFFDPVMIRKKDPESPIDLIPTEIHGSETLKQALREQAGRAPIQHRE